MYRLNSQAAQQQPAATAPPSTHSQLQQEQRSPASLALTQNPNQNQNSQQHLHQEVIPSHILLQQQLNAAAVSAVTANPAISLHPAPSNSSNNINSILASSSESLGVNGGTLTHQQMQQLQANRATNSTIISAPSVEDKIKFLTTAIKTEPLNEVIALTTSLSSNSNNHGNSNNNIIALTVTPSNNSNQTTAIIVPMPSNLSSKSVPLASTTAAAAAAAAATGNTINLVVASSNPNSSASLTITPTQGNANSQVNSSNTSNNGTNGHLVFVPKKARLDPPEDWISTPSPGSVPSSAPPLSPSPGSQNHSYSANMSNGYASPMSVASYDPYSPNGRQGREDLSPSSSLNGYSTNDGCDAKKSKKGPAPRQQEELCLVCGDRASGYHYNALTCEGCKGFFRRSVTKNAKYQCKFGEKCEMDMYMRRKCQECRLKKCLTVGMRPECVVPENQCAMKRREKKAQKDKDKQQASPSACATEYIKKEILDLMQCEQSPPPFPLLTDDQMKECEARNIPQLTYNQLAVIYKLIWYQDGYEQPSEDDLKRIMSSPDENESQTDVSFRHITEITILTVQLIVEFAKGLPAFTRIPQEDQITLLKACSSEVMMLRMARRYDHNSDSIFFANNRSYTRDSYRMAGMADNIEDLLHFCRQMYSMKVDNVEYALLTAIVIFSDRPGLEEADLVEAIQSYYIDTLRIYILNRHCGNPMSLVFFAKLLSILTELRTLGNQNAEMCFSLKLKNRKLPKFLEEIWDVHAIPPTAHSHLQSARENHSEVACTSSAAQSNPVPEENSATMSASSSTSSSIHQPTSTTSISSATSTSNLGGGVNIFGTTNLSLMDVSMAHHEQLLGNPSEHSTLA